MKAHSNTLLILTVGTGTAGKESFIAEGLRKTVELLQPRRYWLVPSDSPSSIEVADFIREHFPDQFAPWSEIEAYACIRDADRLGSCRDTVRQVIRAAKKELRSGERLLVNPTSGTKQMSAGATIAALDEGLGELTFTTGERSDGVVRTGTERLETFDASSYHTEKDRTRAAELFSIGAYAAAARLLGPHSSLRDLGSLCRCLHEWQRQNYREAHEIAVGCPDPRLDILRPQLRDLAEDAKHRRSSTKIAGDLFVRGAEAKNTRDFERALFLVCKAAETLLDHTFQQLVGLVRPYPADRLKALPHWAEADRKKLSTYRDDKRVNLLTGQVLGYLQNEGSLGFLTEPLTTRLRSLLDARNDLVHHLRPVEHDEAHEAIGVVRELISAAGVAVPAPFPREL